MENLQGRDLQGTDRGRSADFAFHLYIGYSNGAMIELIQPVSGESLFHEFLAAHPRGRGPARGVHRPPEAEFPGTVEQLTRKGHSVVLALTLPVATVAFFDTTGDIGVATEVIGLTAAADEFVAQLRSGTF
jgi:hypothetical protein